MKLLGIRGVRRSRHLINTIPDDNAAKPLDLVNREFTAQRPNQLWVAYDDALTETINGLYKSEVIHKDGPWKGPDLVEPVTLEWVDWFNKKRPLEPIGDIPQVQFEENYYRQLAEDTAA